MDKLFFMSLDEFNNRVHMVDSGVYLITDVEDKIIYAGKGLSIKKRVNAHFKGYSKNTQELSYLFNKIAYILEESPLKRSLLEIQFMIEYKTALNKEVQEEFPDIYTEYIKRTNKTCSTVIMKQEMDEAAEQAKIEDVARDLKREKQLIRKQEKQRIELEKQRLEEEKRKKYAAEALELQKKRDRERDNFRKDLLRAVGGKAIFYEVISLLDSGYNPYMLSKALNIDCQAIITIKEHRKDFRVPRNHKRMITHQDIMHSLNGKKDKGNSRLNHLL
ncbi:GIY-YIG nuclease family protein [Bacillus wiedmannii]|uniref:Excinuclease ABC subunit C n=1 Tax=Bacillus wiedmannii TaxID=1890302 RepID=A0A2A7VQP6_9BACI|nr:GIY-YIG nuclease family protein [Bacillus wiedmannii]PEI99369.1 excinuclease ABC subunit C [Bacillus wiedmannii]PHC64248.1 excinuclease ABC subunit C [Bacillus wiedmannii]